jgi:hypothetical protein
MDVGRKKDKTAENIGERGKKPKKKEFEKRRAHNEKTQLYLISYLIKNGRSSGPEGIERNVKHLNT